MRTLPSGGTPVGYPGLVMASDFGGYWDGVHDDGPAIQAACDYAATFSPRKGVMLPPLVGIGISVVVPRDVFVFGYNWTPGKGVNTKIIPLAGLATCATGYAFNLATSDGLNNLSPAPNAWAVGAQVGMFGVFFDNTPNDVVGARLCVFAGNHAKFEDLYGFMPTQMVKQAANVYCDNVTINSVQVLTSLDNTEFLIDLGSNTGGGGDSAWLSNMVFSPSERGSGVNLGPEKAIRVRYSNCGAIRNIINGRIELVGCDGITIDNWHSECAQMVSDRANFTLSNSTLEMHNASSYYIIDLKPSYEEQCSVVLDNVVIKYKYNGREGNGPAEIRLSESVTLTTRNVRKQIGSTAYSSFVGLRVNNKSDAPITAWNNNAGWLSYAGQISNLIPTGEYNVSVTSNNFFGVNGVYQDATHSSYFPSQFSPTDSNTYYYWAQLLIDVTNMIGYNQTIAEKFTTMPGAGCDLIRLVALTTFQAGTTVPNHGTIRIYRGTAPNTYDKYCDIPSFNCDTAQDLGNTVNGLPWVSRTAGPPDTVKPEFGHFSITPALGAVRRAPYKQSPAFAASFACDLALGNQVTVGLLTAAITHQAPTNIPRAGTPVQYDFWQNATGGYGITWSSKHKGAWPTASGTANQKLTVTGISDGTNIVFQSASGWY